MSKVHTLEHTLSKSNKNDLDVIVRSGKRRNSVCGIEFEGLIYLPYWLVKVEIKELLLNNQFSELIILMLKEKGKITTLSEISKENHKELFSFVLWVKDSLEAIFNLEKEYLSNEPDADSINAGIRDFDELGEINTIDNLAGGDILKWEEVKRLPYHQVFDKLRKNTIENKFNKRYQKIIAEKHKNKKR